MNPITKKYKNLRNNLSFMSLMLVFGPFIYYLIEAAINTMQAGTVEQVVAKVSIFSTSVILFGILTIVGLAKKVVFKSSIWILVVAIYLLLDYALYAVVIIGSCQIIDELIVSPLAKHYGQLYTINKEIDKRG